MRTGKPTGSCPLEIRSRSGIVDGRKHSRLVDPRTDERADLDRQPTTAADRCTGFNATARIQSEASCFSFGKSDLATCLPSCRVWPEEAAAGCVRASGLEVGKVFLQFYWPAHCCSRNLCAAGRSFRSSENNEDVGVAVAVHSDVYGMIVCKPQAVHRPARKVCLAVRQLLIAVAS